MSVTRIEEHIVSGKRLGRHIDNRTAAHRQTGGPPPLAPAIVSVTHKSYGLPLDQGDLGSCTANALCGALNTVPHYQARMTPQPPKLVETQAIDLYSAESVLEGYGPVPPADPGGTGAYVCEAAMQRKWVSDFQVATGLDEALRALVLRPEIIGINWYDSMDSPTSAGVVTITPGAQIRGGHELVVVAIDAMRKRIGLPNSWGLGYGVAISGAGIPGGCIWLSFTDFDRLLGEGGDVVVPRTAPGWVAPKLAAVRKAYS